jgi:hypothetical protein
MFTHLPTGTLSPIPDERGRPVTIRTDPLLTQQRRKVKEWEQSDVRKIPDRGIGPVLRGESDAIYVEDPNIQNNQERSDRQPNVFEILQPREGSIDPETQAILEEYSRAMINETDVRNLDNESFTQIPGIGRHIPREWGSDIVGGIHAYGPVPMEYRYTDANGREQFAVKNVYPSEIAQTVGEDPDAKFYNERFGQKPLGKVAGDARRAAKTPLISRSELVEAYKSGKMTVPAETKGNLVGFLGRGGDAKPIAVYKTQLTGGSGEELFRLGAATSVDFDLERQTLADPRVSEEVNALSTRIAGKKGSPREEGFTPFLNRDDIQPNIGGLRRNREKEFYGLTLADALEELTAGGYMASPDVADAYSRILARAAATGEMPTGFGDKPMRGTVESLRSGIDPATPRRRSTNPGQDSPEVTAGKQLRAALLDHVEATGQGVPAEEAVKWAGAIGSRWGVDANTVLTAASDPANDPGRALFAPGSNAEEILQQAVRGESGGRRVDLFSEPPARTPKGGRVKVSDPSVRPGVIDEDDFAEVQARQGSFGITKRKETPRDNDPLEPVFAMAAQYKANPAEAEYLAKAAIAENWSRVERGLGDDLPAVMQSLAAPTTRQVMVGQKPYASKEASAVRTKGQKAPTGRPQLRSYADFANAMGEEVGSERQERALTEMALRMRAREGSQAAVNEEASNVPQRIDQGVPAEQLNAPTSGPTPDSGMDAAAIAGTPDEGAPGGYANARLAALKRRLLQR